MPELIDREHRRAVELAGAGRWVEAEASLRQIIAWQPGDAQAHSNLGSVLARQARLSEAESWFRRATQLDPRLVPALINLGDLLKDTRRHEQAIASYRQSLALEPENADAHFNLAWALLAVGRYAEAWPHYEYRLQLAPPPTGPPLRPRWQGEPLDGRTLLVRCEQGLGDTLQFVRFARKAQERGGSVIVECLPNIARLVASCPGVDGVAVVGQPLPAFDVEAPLGSLPGILATTVETIPAQVPYVFAAQSDVTRWRAEMSQSEPALRVGIFWQGNPRQTHDAKRSVPLAQFAPLATVPGVQCYGLQVGPGREQLIGLPWKERIVDLGDRVGDFSQTAALVQALDLVITCDSSPAHLSGALGVPAWVALAETPDWRWMLDGQSTPWYPTMQLFRQRQGGDWGEVFGRIAAELRALSAQQA